ncbi:MAG TPA: pyridoxal 5'-phosphate synthase glutaminase subunit PdxT [Bryobacteraceae bacterium]|jgi:5'-phosphate synthase pdxT subunit|nr:pyridoxal 5'-phosphate synthase glutaminase subunit PdxT [Bryobacteraceae bacterium]
MKKVGVLSLQGDFGAHGAALERAGAEPVFVREPSQFAALDGLIIPGGESTTMLKLMGYEPGLFDALREFGAHKPVFGTCAGAILMANDVSNPPQQSFQLMDIAVERNAYGRQIDSRVAEVETGPEFEQRTAPGKMEAVFIRAPIIRRVGPEARVLIWYQGDPVLVEQGRHLAATFHPELTSDPRVHSLFLEKL